MSQIDSGDLIRYSGALIDGGAFEGCGFIFGREESELTKINVIFDIEDSDIFLIVEKKLTFDGMYFKILGENISTWIFEDEIIRFQKLKSPE